MNALDHHTLTEDHYHVYTFRGDEGGVKLKLFLTLRADGTV